MAQAAVKRGVIWLHKWLGVVLALFFAMWFASGIVLYFVPFPALTQAERLAGLPAITAAADCCLGVDEAAGRAGLDILDARLGMHAGAPVWRVLGTPRGLPAAAPAWRVLDARTGALVPALDASQAAALAQQFSGRPARAVQAVVRDQWTVAQGLDPYRPLYRVSLGPGAGDDDGLELYVSARAAEVVRDTRRTERFWNWIGAVPHWIYPTALRQFPRAWHHVVVWLSLPGVVAAATGLVLGIWQLFLNRSRWIPYRKFWMRWHHVLGLAAALCTLTWIVSGLLSMNPFGVFGPSGPTASERANWQGPPATLRLPVGQALRLAAADGMAVREATPIRLLGQPWYLIRGVGRQAMVRADGPAPTALAACLPQARVVDALRAMRGAAPARLDRLDAYDDQYYPRHPDPAEDRWQRPLPVWRAEWHDGVLAYADPCSGRLVLRTDVSGRWQRVLYHGLHSLDFAPLRNRPGLRTALVLGLSGLGLALCATACVLAWRVTCRGRPRR